MIENRHSSEVKELSRKVSAAITIAKDGEGQSGGTYANRVVSYLNEQIAERLDNSDFSGLAARRGAIEAAVLARDMDRAVELIGFYSCEPGTSRQSILRMRKLVPWRKRVKRVLLRPLK